MTSSRVGHGAISLVAARLLLHKERKTKGRANGLAVPVEPLNAECGADAVDRRHPERPTLLLRSNNLFMQEK